MLAEAKVDRTHAERIAIGAAHGGKVKSGQIERYKGHLVWSFDIVRPNTSAIAEVLIDAATGKVVSVQKRERCQGGCGGAGGSAQEALNAVRFRLRRLTRALVIVFAVCASSVPHAHAQGGPPMITDDPGTRGNGRFEINLAFASSVRPH